MFCVGRAAFGKRLHVIEFDKPPRGAGQRPPSAGDEGALPALPNVRRAARGDRQVPSACVGLTDLICCFMAWSASTRRVTPLAERRPEGAWAPSVRLIARVRLIACAARVPLLDADPEASLLLSLDEASRLQLDQAPGIAPWGVDDWRARGRARAHNAHRCKSPRASTGDA